MASSRIPSRMKEIQVKTLGTDFRKVTELVEVDVPKPGPKELLVRNSYVGVNAADINYVSGRYEPNKKTPFACGFEAMGQVVLAGARSDVEEGDFVVYIKSGAFAEYVVVPVSEVIPIPLADPALMTIALSGLTASISLEKQGHMKAGQTVLVTAAAGGTGQFAVQIAKAAGCHVIGTCSTDAKVEFLKSIGCDRPINYKKENLDEVLSKEYPKGLDLIYECIGKEMFDTALKHIAMNGHLIIIGMISHYLTEGEIKYEATSNIPLTLLSKNASMSGFFLLGHTEEFPQHIGSLTQLYAGGQLKITVDKGLEKPFKGLEAVADAIEYMFSGKNVGKVVVTLSEE